MDIRSLVSRMSWIITNYLYRKLVNDHPDIMQCYDHDENCCNSFYICPTTNSSCPLFFYYANPTVNNYPSRGQMIKFFDGVIDCRESLKTYLSSNILR